MSERRKPEPRPEQHVIDHACKTAIDSAITAGKHVLRYWPNPLNPSFDRDAVMEIFEKKEGVGNYATIADLESERIIITAIQAEQLFADHQIIAEESDAITSESEYQWVIDPIDGTIPYKNGLPDFGICIGLLHAQEPVMGVIAMPALGQLIASRKGHGVHLYSFDGEKLSTITNDTGDTREDRLLVSYDLGFTNRGEQLQSIVSKLADKVNYAVSYASSATAHFRMAQGLLSAYFHSNPTRFDIGAPAAIVTELGGEISDMKGNPIDWTSASQSYLGARNPAIHQHLLTLLNS